MLILIWTGVIYKQLLKRKLCLGVTGTAIRKRSEDLVPMLAGGLNHVHLSATKNEGMELNPVYNEMKSILPTLVTIIFWK